MALIRDWERDIKAKETDDLKKIRDAFDVLLGWDFFKKAYHGDGHSTIRTIVDCELKYSRESKVDVPGITDHPPEPTKKQINAMMTTINHLFEMRDILRNEFEKAVYRMQFENGEQRSYDLGKKQAYGKALDLLAATDFNINPEAPVKVQIRSLTGGVYDSGIQQKNKMYDEPTPVCVATRPDGREMVVKRDSRGQWYEHQYFGTPPVVCDNCNAEISGDVEEIEGLTVCKKCYLDRCNELDNEVEAQLRAERGGSLPERKIIATKIRKSLNGKLHLSGGPSAAHCSSGNRGMNFDARVSAQNAKAFPLDCFCKKCFGSDPLGMIDRMIKNESLI